LGVGFAEQRGRLRAKVTHHLAIGHRRCPRREPLLLRVRVRVEGLGVRGAGFGLVICLGQG